MYGENFRYSHPPPAQYAVPTASAQYIMMPAAVPLRYIPPQVQFPMSQQASHVHIEDQTGLISPLDPVMTGYAPTASPYRSPPRNRFQTSGNREYDAGSCARSQWGRERGISNPELQPRIPVYGIPEQRARPKQAGNEIITSVKHPDSGKGKIAVFGSPSAGRERAVIHLKDHTTGPKLSDFISQSQSKKKSNIRISKEVLNTAPKITEEWPSLSSNGNIESALTEDAKTHIKNETQDSKPKKRKPKRNRQQSDDNLSTDRDNNDRNKEKNSEDVKISYVDKLKAPPKPQQNVEPEKQQNWRDQRTKAKKGDLQKKLKNGFRNSEEAENNSIVDGSKDVERGVADKTDRTERPQKQKKGKSERERMEKGEMKRNEVQAEPKEGKVETEGGKRDEQEEKAGASEAVKARRKARRALIRARKKEQKEAEKLLEMRGPKDSKITVLSGKMLEKYLKATSSHQSKTKAFKVETEEFPELITASPAVVNETARKTLAEIVKQEVVVKEEPFMDEDSVWNDPPPKPPAQEEKKVPKPRDPIEFNLFDIAMAKSVMKMRKKEQKKSTTQSVKRRVDSDKIVANPLDASAPVLSRGKIRTKPKKPSLLKRAILKQRQERQKILAVSAGMVAASSRPSETLDNGADGEWTDQEASEELGSIVLVKRERKKKKKEKKLEPGSDKPISHNRKFREYCDQMLTDEIDSVCVDLLHDLVRFQDRAHQKDPIKAKMRKRLVFGLREVTKQVERGRVKAVIVAPNLEKCSEPGGLDDAIRVLLDRVREKNVFCVYALDRWRLSRATKKRGMTSCLGILNYQGSDENYKKLVSLVCDARAEYERRRPKEESVDSKPGPEATEPDFGIQSDDTALMKDVGVSSVLLSLIKAEIKE